MSRLSAICPGPDGWISEAQAALDELATARTLEEVEVRFGSARRLTELVLGFPVSGGHATRRAIRAVGRLLCHRLGPSIAVEALTWAASLSNPDDASTTEALLELAYESPGTYRPWRLDNPPACVGVIRSVIRQSQRRQMLLELWNHIHADLYDPDSVYRPDQQPALPEPWNDNELEDIASWLRGMSSDQSLLACQALSAWSPEEQRELVDGATAREIEWIAQRDDLFEMDLSVLGRCLLEATRLTLCNPACPKELRDRVRFPYDLATLELALRAGPDLFDRARVRRMVTELDDDALRNMVDGAPRHTLPSLGELGLITPAQLLHGGLSSLDLADPRTCRTLFGKAHNPHSLDLASALAPHHAQAKALGWIFDRAPLGALAPDRARQLVDVGHPRIAKAAMRHVPFALLRPTDRACAADCGDPWLAACPGLRAVERPRLSPDRLASWRHWSVSRPALIWYPAEVLQLESTKFEVAPRWRVRLPRTVDEIRHNAKVMRNCTAGLIDRALDGSVFLVIVHDPGGHRYNVAILKDGDCFVVGHINSWANGGVEPPWIRSAFTKQLNARDDPVLWDNHAPAHHRATPRRDRRRSRARVARRLRR